MFKIKCSDIPNYIAGTENNSLAELAMPGAASGISYEGIGAENFLGPMGAEYQPFLALSDTDNYPWLTPIPHYSAKINNKDYKLVHRSCCNYINPTSKGKTFTPTSEFKEWYNDGNNNWNDQGGGQNLFIEPTSHIMIAMQAGGGGGAGSSGVHNGTGGGGGAAAVLIINIGKLQSIRFNPGRGGHAGLKSIDANTNRHGGDGTDSAIVMKLWNGDTLTAYVEGGSGGLAYSSNAGAGREGGTGGRAMVFVESSRNVNLTASISDTDLTSVNYVGIKADGTKLSYPDTNYEAVFYVLKVVGGGKGAADSALLSDAVTSPIISTSINVPFSPGVSHTIPALSKRSHTYANYTTAGYDGGDGGYSLYGQGGLCSISYFPNVNSTIPLWTNAQPPTGYGAGGSGDVFLIFVGKDGTAGGDGFIQILSANSTTAQLPDILPQSGILSSGAVICSYVKIDDTFEDDDYGTPEFVACSYAYNNNNVLTPTLHTVGSNPKEYPIDWSEAYFHIGTEIINRTTYDKWQKIESNGQYTWNNTSKKIAYTNRVVKNGRFIADLCNRDGVHTVDTSSDAVVVAPTCIEQGYTYSKCTECGYRFKGNIVPALGHSVGDWEITREPTITQTGKRVKKCSRCKNIIESEILPMLDPEVGTYELLATNAVVPKYYLRTDSTGELTEGTYEDMIFVAAGYLNNNNNIVTPVLYGTDPTVSPEPYLEDAFFYVGQETISGIVYDKWKKIEMNGGSYTWTSSMSYYIYTNVVVSNNRFASNIFANSVSGTVTVPWGVRKIMLPTDELPTYIFSAVPQSVSAPDGYIIQEVTSLVRDSMGLISGKVPLVTPSSSISSDGKTLSITLTSSATPFAVGEGDAIVSYTYTCGPVFEVVDSTSVSIPYTTANSPTNGNQYSITSQSPATITAPDGYVIIAVKPTSLKSAASHSLSYVTASASIASNKKTATVSLSGAIQGAYGSSMMTVNCDVTYRQVG